MSVQRFLTKCSSIEKGSKVRIPKKKPRKPKVTPVKTGVAPVSAPPPVAPSAAPAPSPTPELADQVRASIRGNPLAWGAGALGAGYVLGNNNN